ncbi:MAG: calcium-binding protein [Cyanobacteria bacterium J06592_8]
MTSITGTSLPDTLLGESGIDIIFGLEGSDLIRGSTGNDSIYGNQGNDEVFGGSDDDVIYGGKGDDFLDGDSIPTTSIDFLLDLDTPSGNDLILGNLGADIIFGGELSDTLFGGQGNDSIIGGTGGDLVSGDLGDDLLVGVDLDLLSLSPNPFSSITFSSFEKDTLIGGAGADEFFLGDTSNIYYNESGDDDYALIVDFNLSEGDLIIVTSSGDYFLDNISLPGLGSGAGIFLNPSFGSRELIGFVQGIDASSLTGFGKFVQV